MSTTSPTEVCCRKCGRVMPPDEAVYQWQPCTSCFFEMTPAEMDAWPDVPDHGGAVNDPTLTAETVKAFALAPSPTVREATPEDHAELRRLLDAHAAAFDAYFQRLDEETGSQAFEAEVRVCNWLHLHGFSTIAEALAPTEAPHGT